MQCNDVNYLAIIDSLNKCMICFNKKKTKEIKPMSKIYLIE